MTTKSAPTSGFAALLKRLCDRAGLTQEELAERAGLSARGVSDIERGLKRAPRQITVRMLADGLGLDGAERAAFLAAARPHAEAAPASGEPSVAVAPSEPEVAAESRPGYLPAAPTSIVGRADEVGRVRAQLAGDDVRLLTLTGPGGVGKTRLAVEAASGLTEAFPDGVFFVELAAVTDPRLVLAEIARRLDLHESGTRSLAEQLADELRGKRLLLVLDNVEQVVGAAVDVADLLTACPGLTVLATSRTLLRVRAEREFPVAPLALPSATRAARGEDPSAFAAVALFVERARAANARFVLNAENAAAASCRPRPVRSASAAGRRRPPAGRARGGGRDLPTARRVAARDRVGGWVVAGTGAGGAAGAPRRPPRPAEHGSARPADAAANDAQRDRLESRPARPGGAGAVPPARGLRRRLLVRHGRMGDG